MIREDIFLYMMKAGVRQSNLCQQVDLTCSNLNGYLQGKRAIPYEKFLSTLSALGLSVGSIKERKASQPASELHKIVSDAIDSTGYKTKDIAKKAGINVSCLSSFLTGKRRLPYKSLDSLFGVLNLKVLPIMQ